MQDFLVTSILPYAVMAGVAASVFASIGLVANALLLTRSRESKLLPRLIKIEEAIRRDTSRIDLQFRQAERDLKPEAAQSVVVDLSLIADDLQKRASEVHRLLDELRSDGKIADHIENRKRFVDLGLAMDQTEVSLKSVVRRLEQKKQEMERSLAG